MNTDLLIGAGTLLAWRGLDFLAASRGWMYRSSDLGPAASSPATGPGQTGPEPTAPALSLALPQPAAEPQQAAAAPAWTTRPVAAYLGVHERTVTHWADAGLLTAARDWRGRRVYDGASVESRKAAMNGVAP